MILLLSDNQETAAAIQADLAREGFEIELETDHRQALKNLGEDSQFQLVLLDIAYSKHDAFDICRRIKSDKNLKLIPLVCLLEKNRFVDQLLAFEMGADDFIFLPYSALEIQLKFRSLHRLIDLQTQIQQKDAQLENLKNIQRIMVTLNHYINNALTPLYFAVQIMEEGQPADADRVKNIAKETVEFISKVLQSLHKIVQSGKLKILKEGVYKDIMLDIEQELNRLIEKTK
ncbi:MAG: response regulator [Calditrichaeota bacterium]|nr:response regulator [Calditrichota bacterium]MCB0304866.1 response regulator [Calditrichota bacterium]MCB0313994.1 response regulator [Calditrichota bacterium]